MRRTVIVLAAVAILAAAAGRASAGDGEHRRVRKCHGIEWREGPGRVADLVRCVARAFGAPRPPLYAVDVARCESGLNPRVIGGSGDNYLGLFQFYRGNWPSVVGHWVRPLELVGLRWTNAEAQAIAAARIARSRGTWSGYWACA